MKKICFSLLFLLLPLLFKTQVANNIDFEQTPAGTYSTANAVSGWTIESTINSSIIYPPNIEYGAACTGNPINPEIGWGQGSQEFSIVATPFFNVPYLGTLPQSPFGGTKVARLNNTIVGPVISNITKISHQFQVSNSNSLLQLAYAGSWEGYHECCGTPALRINLYSCNGPNVNSLPCGNFNLTPANNCINGVSGYSLTGIVFWTNWQIKNIDLSPYIGQCIRIVILSSDCAYGGHHGSALVDLRCGNQLVAGGSGAFGGNVPGTVNYCSGSNQAILTAPVGYNSYQWIAPGGFTVAAPQGTSTSLSVNSPSPGSVYTLQVNGQFCQNTLTYSLNPTQVSIAAINTTSACIGAANGSATLFASGSGTGYNYIWLNSASLTVGTGSIVNNLSAGVYSVIVSAFGAAGCGTAMATSTISLRPPNYITTNTVPYCTSNPTLCPGAGSNYQWYSNLSLITGSIGTGACLAINNPSNNAVYRVSYLSSQGCQDSIQYTLAQLNPGTLSVINSPSICPGINTGTAIVTMTPALGAPSGLNSFSVFSIGNFTPPYSASVNSTSLSNFGVSNLSSLMYSVMASDGICSYNSTFVILPYINSFTISPQTTTLCSGNTLPVNLLFPSPPNPNAYSYSWTPSNFLSGTTQQQVLITPTIATGNVASTIYTVILNSNEINCPISNTFMVTYANPASPSIAIIPLLCSSSPFYTINVLPAGGSFSSQIVGGSFPIGNLNGVISPSIASIGINTFTYTAGTGTCVASSTSTYFIGGPSLFISPNSAICLGQSINLQATGANSYTWSTGALSSTISVSPFQTSVYTVTGSHTLDVCVNTKTVTISVLPVPTIQISGNFTICEQSSSTLTAYGATNFTWSTGWFGPNIVVVPNLSSTYTVTGINPLNGCNGSQTVAVNIQPNPSLTVSSNFTACEGEQVNLFASGASNYQWNIGSTSPSIAVIPISTSMFVVTGSSAFGCTSTKTITVYIVECVGLSENEKNNSKLKVYPNPSNGVITIETKQEVEITIFNELGQLILKQNLSAGFHSIDLSVYASGVYFINTNSNEKAQVFRLIKEN